MFSSPNRGLSHSYSIHSSIRKGAWNHMLWSSDATIVRRKRGNGSIADASKYKSDMYAATQRCE